MSKQGTGHQDLAKADSKFSRHPACSALGVTGGCTTVPLIGLVGDQAGQASCTEPDAYLSGSGQLEGSVMAGTFASAGLLGVPSARGAP